MICKDDFKESKLTYFNEGYMNKLYTCEVNGEKCLVRINDNPINKIYEYSYLFENFLGCKVFVLNNNTIAYKYIKGIPLIDKIKDISCIKEYDIFKNVGELLSNIHAITFDKYLYKGINFESWNDLIKSMIAENKNEQTKKALDYFEKIYFKEYSNYDPKKQLLHGDLSVKNIIVSESEKLHCVDWDSFVIGDKWFDISNFLFRIYRRCRTNVEYDLIKTAFIEGYFKSNKTSVEKFIQGRLHILYSLLFLINNYNHWIKRDNEINMKTYENRIDYLIGLLH